MSVRNGSASDADCRISEDCSVPDVELMALGPLLEERGGRQGPCKGVHPEVGILLGCFFFSEDQRKVYFLCLMSNHLFEGSSDAC